MINIFKKNKWQICYVEEAGAPARKTAHTCEKIISRCKKVIYAKSFAVCCILSERQKKI